MEFSYEGLQTILNGALAYGQLTLTILGGLVTFVAILAPLTKTQTDDRVLGFLKGLHNMLVKLVPNAASKPVKNVNGVYDHRKAKP